MQNLQGKQQQLAATSKFKTNTECVAYGSTNTAGHIALFAAAAACGPTMRLGQNTKPCRPG
jgi:hypothetical protein